MPESTTDLYLDLLERTLLDVIYHSEVATEQHWDARRAGQAATDGEVEEGLYWPARAHTMVGRRRLRQLRDAVGAVIENNVPGDLIETGVWRGGASILMRGVLKAYQVTDRTVFVADSFIGLPPPDRRYPMDDGDAHADIDYLRVSQDTVAGNFARYGLLDDQVVFIEGFFEDTLPTYGFGPLAVIRLDGDMYSSTIQALDALYDKLSPGGYLIIDDYALPGCKAAIDDYRQTHGISEPIESIDWTGAFWRKAL